MGVSVAVEDILEEVTAGRQHQSMGRDLSLILTNQSDIKQLSFPPQPRK